MKRFLSLFGALGIALATFAQLAGGDGFYRVKNVDTERYITVVDNTIRGSKTNPDLSQSLLTIAGFENVVSDPASVIYFRNVTGLPSVRYYDLYAQGTDTHTLSQGRHLEIQGTPGSYKAYASDAGFSKYLFDSDDAGDYGKVVTFGTNGNARRDWDIIPINHESGQFFGFTSEVDASGKYYSTTLASFGFSLSSGMKAYYIDEVDVEQGMAILKEITGDVPAGTPVIIECSSSSAEDNMVDLLESAGGKPSDNKLTGTYFENKKAYNANTMRVLGKAPDGTLAFVKAQTTYLERNKAYLEVPAGSPDVLTVVTRDFYEKEINNPVVVTVENVTREYGRNNPQFTYTVNEGAELNGEPEITCAADALSSVKDGPYEIKITKGTIKNKNVTLKSGLLTVEPKTLYVYAQDYERFAGEENPTFEMEIVGFVNGETEDVLTEKPTLVCAADKTSEEGEYAITPTGGVADNYVFDYQEGTLTVYARNLNVNDTARVYGDPNPVFTYEPSGLLDEDHQPVIICEATQTSPVGQYSIDVDEEETPLENFTYTSGTLTIKKAPLKITVEAAARKQGEDNPAFKLIYEGFKNNETEDVLGKKPVVTCEAAKNCEPGVYDIIVSGAESQNYEITYVNGKLTVYQADGVAVVAKNYEREYGEENPAFEFTTEGAALQGTPEITCELGKTQDVGVYENAIVVSKGSITNLNVTYTNGTLTITKAPLKISVVSTSRKQGEENPQFELLYEGFKNQETADVLEKKPVVTCTAVKDSKPGEYQITLSGAEAKNYEISYVAGTLTVLQADAVAVMANNYEREYGDENPEFGFTTEGAELEGTPEIVCEADKNSPAGTYPIVISKGSISNYNVTYQNGTLTIKKAKLEVGVKDCQRIVGEENPSFEITYNGWKNDENEDVLKVKPTATTSATAESAPGVYAIVVSGAESENYDFVYTNGTLTVKEVDGIFDLMKTGAKKCDVYTTSGVLVKKSTNTLKGLSKGVYIVEGQKVVVK